MFKFWSKYSKESVPIAGNSFSPVSTSFMILDTETKTKTSARDCSSHYASATISLQLF